MGISSVLVTIENKLRRIIPRYVIYGGERGVGREGSIAIVAE